MKSLRFMTSGLPPFSATMLAPKFDLQRREAIELVQHHVGHRVALQLDDEAHALAVALVAHIGDALERFSRTSSAIRSISVALLTW